MKNHLIQKNTSLLEALKRINTLPPEPLVLFVLNEENQIEGTLTDGDARRALIAGASVNDCVEKVMHRNFNYIKVEGLSDIQEIKRLRELKMQLLPVLDKNKHLLEIINLEMTRNLLPIDAVLMAGGKGERLRPLTEKTPKPLLPVGSKAIIDYNIDRLINFGIKHISVTVNYLGEKIEEHFNEPYRDIKINVIREPKFLGTIGSIHFIPRFYNDTVLVMNSDLFTNIDLENFYLHFKESGAEMSAAAVPYTVSVPYGIFNESDEQIIGLTEKPTYNYYANAGIYLFKREVLSMIPKEAFFNATDLIQLLISQNKKVVRFPLHGYWIDIGNKNEYTKAQDIARFL